MKREGLFTLRELVKLLHNVDLVHLAQDDGTAVDYGNLADLKHSVM